MIKVEFTLHVCPFLFDSWSGVFYICLQPNYEERKRLKLNKTQGEIAYEADTRRRSTYHDGTPRKKWSELSEIARCSWEQHLGKPDLTGKMDRLQKTL